MWSGWTVRQFAVYVLPLLVFNTGIYALIGWLSPGGADALDKSHMAMWGGAGGITGVMARYVHVKHPPSPELSDFQDTVPRAGWIAFGAFHGVLVGLMLGLAWQLPGFLFLLLVLGFGALMAVFGAFLPKLRRPRADR